MHTEISILEAGLLTLKDLMGENIVVYVLYRRWQRTRRIWWFGETQRSKTWNTQKKVYHISNHHNYFSYICVVNFSPILLLNLCVFKWYVECLDRHIFLEDTCINIKVTKRNLHSISSMVLSSSKIRKRYNFSTHSESNSWISPLLIVYYIQPHANIGFVIHACVRLNVQIFFSDLDVGACRLQRKCSYRAIQHVIWK